MFNILLQLHNIYTIGCYNQGQKKRAYARTSIKTYMKSIEEDENHMNCHGKHEDNNNGNGQGKSRKGHLSHMLMMVLCCGAPVLILLLVPFISKIGGPGTAKFLAVAAPFLCPLMMVFMIPMMLKGGKGKAGKADSRPGKRARLAERTWDE